MLTPDTFDVPEQSSGVYRAIIVDESGALLPGSILSTLTLTLYAVRSGGNIDYINSRNAQNVLNTNGVTVYDTLQTDTLFDSSTVQYNLKWIFTPQDTTLVRAQLQIERHIALFEWTWGSGKAGKQEMILAVKNLNEV